MIDKMLSDTFTWGTDPCRHGAVVDVKDQRTRPPLDGKDMHRVPNNGKK